MAKPIASSLSERHDMDAAGEGGSVQDDLNAIFDDEDMDLEDALDYFGDEDPTLYL
jgi:hypothetical protein